MVEACHHRLDEFRKVIPMGGNPHQVFQLTEGDKNPGGGNKAGNHRVGEEIGQKAQPQYAQQEQKQAGQQCQQRRRQQIVRRILGRYLTECRGAHQ